MYQRAAEDVRERFALSLAHYDQLTPVHQATAPAQPAPLALTGGSTAHVRLLHDPIGPDPDVARWRFRLDAR